MSRFVPTASLSPHRQRGMATLFMTLAALFLITIATLFAKKTAVFELLTSANQYRHTQALSAAQGGLDFGLAWLGTNGNPNGSPYNIPVGGAGAVWVADPSRLTEPSPFNERNSSSVAVQTVGTPAYTVTVTLWRDSTRPRLVEVVSVATGEATATVRQVVDVNALGFANTTLPSAVVKGCIGSITGTPSINGPILMDNGATAPATCFDQGHFTVTDTPTFSAFPLPGATTPTAEGGAWEMLFGTMSRADMLQLSRAQPGGQVGGPIYYYTNADAATTAPNNWTSSLGTETAPVVLLFDSPTLDNCPKVTGGVTIYGVVYCRIGLDMQGWGSTVIYGTLATDTNITKYTANAVLNPLANGGLPTSYPVPPVISKVPGTWRDF